MSGRIHLVGAGPGDADLLTVRAARLIAAADVIVHDRLVGPDVLAGCRPGTELVDVSKRPGKASVAQEEINRILISRARSGLDVVRLKGGDPFVFGRGGEEAIALAAAGIEFELVPGISSALAGPAAAGIPVTHREAARSFAVMTAHAAGLDGHDWSALAAVDTLVVLMGAATAGLVTRRLLQAGRAADTPAAAVQEATLAGQREVRSTLAALPDAIAADGLRAPLVLVIGAVAALDVRCAVASEVAR
ncbi:uroporphyrinogen-III C-methyltransferase [Gaiella occulta]|uniref:uroporphyrinogen-III C-methyltransferase n=1 Tax=Gaiella occulta TaxID=1002870 RepID=A0A7M2YUQ4_9ACTN|nr:uroporphyrinogen-III C-methyltransferase [Gaiella occulta]RDI73594.1 uroporphyrinogen-III C-methyltransferase [Gaiella occulta]